MQKFEFSLSAAFRFRVVSYNILADLYCDSDYTRQVLHPYCPPYALAIDYRKQLVLKELLGTTRELIFKMVQVHLASFWKLYNMCLRVIFFE